MKNSIFAKSIFSLLILQFMFFCVPNETCAQAAYGIEVVPQIIDEKVMANDILKYTVKIKNNSDVKANLYATVNDITSDGGIQDYTTPSKLDRETSLTRWINIKRGVIELLPGESTEIPLEIDVYLAATPGKRYAVIAFPEGTNRKLAEEKMKNEPVAEIRLNFEVVENKIERAQVKLFKAEKNVFLKPPVKFEVIIDNFGNQEITPTGSVYIYNRRSVEVAEIIANEDSQSVKPDDSLSLKLDWPDNNSFGKYKARLELEYGDGRSRDLQDTVYFWVLPMKFLLIFSIGLFFLIALLTILVFRKTFNYQPSKKGASPRLESDGVINLRKK